MATVCNSIQSDLASFNSGSAVPIAHSMVKPRMTMESNRILSSDQIVEQEVFLGIIGSSRVLKRVLSDVAIVAPTDSTVLIEGETGSGKELIARAIHRLSQRRDRNIVRFNCAAVPEGLLESELFGHERGAFTGAVTRKIGRFELADMGTLFLDEIGELPLHLQSKLLRVLQEQEFERLGSIQTQRVNVRLVAATNRDLRQMVAQKQFRSDLYYRLHIFPISVPPVRDRQGDIRLLVEAFVAEFAERLHRNIEMIPEDTMAAMVSYPWPGNIRELRNFVERAVILSKGPVLSAPLESLSMPGTPPAGQPITLHQAECDHILSTLKQTQWIIGGPNGAAARLGLKRTTLISKMQKLGLSRQTHAVTA